jgi:NAD(P)-dependent dehydrogenase (short-subunit alcohol dehydrogenase family)
MPLSRPFADSVVVVTGASSGIGATTALLLARQGTSLVLTARGGPDLRRVVAACERRGSRVTSVTGDIAEPDTAELVAARAEDAYGRVDGWVNNAGVAEYCSLLDVPVEEVRRVLDVDLLGTLLGVQAARSCPRPSTPRCTTTRRTAPGTRHAHSCRPTIRRRWPGSS